MTHKAANSLLTDEKQDDNITALYNIVIFCVKDIERMTNIQKKSLDTQERILQAGRSEFLAYGFMDASLRNIAKNAGVTTGAIYGYYPDKKALFDALVQMPASTLRQSMIGVQDDFAAMPAELQMSDMYSFSTEALQKLFDFIYENLDAFKLIILCSAGTDYENYLDSLVEIECGNTARFTAAMKDAGFAIPEISANLSHVLASAYFQSLFEAVAHDMPRADADEYIAGLTKFFHAGWDAILKQK
jgi:AcrR family transcriptional regulator